MNGSIRSRFRRENAAVELAVSVQLGPAEISGARVPKEEGPVRLIVDLLPDKGGQVRWWNRENEVNAGHALHVLVRSVRKLGLPPKSDDDLFRSRSTMVEQPHSEIDAGQHGRVVRKCPKICRS